MVQLVDDVVVCASMSRTCLLLFVCCSRRHERVRSRRAIIGDDIGDDLDFDGPAKDIHSREVSSNSS